MPVKPHPTDPDKMVFVSRKYDFDPNYWRKHASEYERGFIDGMQKQMQSSVDRAVNAMAKREWVGLTDEEIKKVIAEVSQIPPIDFTSTTYARAVEAKLKQKNGYAEEKNT